LNRVPILMWLPLSQHLLNYITTYTDKQGKHVFEEISDYSLFTARIGSLGDARTYPCMEILFDNETKDDPQKENEGITSLWLDFYTNTGSDSPEDNYIQAYQMVNDLAKLTLVWPRKLVIDEKIASSVAITGVLSDGDTARPVFQIRVVLEIHWKKSRI